MIGHTISHSCYVAIVISIVNGHGLGIDMRDGN